ncbi:hepatic triacylglycerol lipase precursor [Oryctolagus cuniculus]|uniref:Hepatic triacylglycerol lipase n=1 Tax=Oryctolagus cuniculus TaxID=9986 RepID=LIPC_RABIT|nr:hepatic triacylglycerol lipase precursor [Oryctolagus cuniculus]O46559.1 RecName: Full=Hepatic triacylglycerol lipase; Short=HL; Short=Hepatic lipase; AltName: Full=Lipase member C; AltName: Full=Lysophospholipase; AltName: Full=Phospholipase A1; Flags: Precursor [Oryctolagus cuniculus]AAB96786.1 hepatic lipase [Oryctolagus cuniculus]
MGSPLCVPIFLAVCILIQSSTHGQSLRPEPFGRRARVTATKKTLLETETRFLLFKDKANKGCQIRLHHADTLQECGFNSSLPLVMIVHGWSVDGLLESWIWQMVAALKSQPARPVNVGLVDWISLAHSHYAVAVRNARLVGQEVAALLQWLEESAPFSRSNVHLIGYSLGAHVAGFAGSYISGKHKIGRITGLDAAGPLFEGTSASDRLSPDDATFVDAIHTFTREHMGLSVGIKQPVGHYDFYPNGGSFQPGCHFLELYKHIAQHGLNALSQTIKCAHERSVHLFIDSLLHPSMQSTAYQCSDMDSFSQGLCLGCTKGRCNTLGYHIRQEPLSKGKRLFLVTQAQSPFRVYHYQFKIQFINQIEKPLEPTFTMSLLGTKEEMQKIPITLGEGITSNKTYSFLITLNLDIGELMVIKFKWENSAVWANVWNTVQTIIPWGIKPRNSGLILKTIRVKAGETQQRMTFCSENMDDLQLHPTQEKNFVRCEVNPKKLKLKIK